MGGVEPLETRPIGGVEPLETCPLGVDSLETHPLEMSLVLRTGAVATGLVLGCETPPPFSIQSPSSSNSMPERDRMFVGPFPLTLDLLTTDSVVAVLTRFLSEADEMKDGGSSGRISFSVLQKISSHHTIKKVINQFMVNTVNCNFLVSWKGVNRQTNLTGYVIMDY